MKPQLIILMDQFGLTATRLADEIGVQRSSISHILSERNRPSYDFILKVISRYPELNAEWLLTGKGDMLKKEVRNNNEKENNLFNQKEKLKEKEEDVGSNSLYDKKDTLQEYKDKNNEITNVNIIEKVIILYHDKTFAEYNSK